MTPEELKNTLHQHVLWLRSQGGEKANLSEANLTEANLYGANLYRADLTGADLYGANLSGADLSEADLSEAHLTIANLYGANLSGANLSGANLYRANLYGANLSGANLYGANLSGAIGIMQFGPMPTSGRIIYAVRHDSGWMVQAGCFWGTLDKLEEEVKAVHNCPMYLGIIQLLRNTTNQ